MSGKNGMIKTDIYQLSNNPSRRHRLRRYEDTNALPGDLQDRLKEVPDRQYICADINHEGSPRILLVYFSMAEGQEYTLIRAKELFHSQSSYHYYHAHRVISDRGIRDYFRRETRSYAIIPLKISLRPAWDPYQFAGPVCANLRSCLNRNDNIMPFRVERRFIQQLTALANAA